MPEREVEVSVDGQVFTGWEQIEVERSLLSGSGACTIAMSTQRLPFPIRPNQGITIAYGEDQILLNGYVDALLGSDRDGVVWTINGRDRTSDVIDSSSTVEPGEWLNQPVLTIARDLIETPFGIAVLLRGDQGEPFPRFSLDPGESPWLAVERACRLRGLLVYFVPGPGEGFLLISDASTRDTSDAVLEEGVNIKHGRMLLNASDRFRSYVVKGQNAAGDAFFLAGLGVDPNLVSGVKGEASDSLFRADRNRVLVVLAEGNVSPDVAQERAEWEASVRAARSARLEVTVQGWLQQSYPGQRDARRLWAVNELVQVTYPKFDLQAQFLVDLVRFRADDRDGTVSLLSLVRPDAYVKQPDIGVGDKADPFGFFREEEE